MNSAKAIAIAIGLIVTASAWHQSEMANADSCRSHDAALAKRSQAAPSLSASIGGQMRMEDFERRYPGPCSDSLSSEQILNGALAGALIGFMCHTFGLLYGKFRRWVQK